jgi:hypothetical protein
VPGEIRFDDEPPRARGKGSLAVLGQVVDRHDDDRRCVPPGGNPSGRLQTVHVRHGEVHEDEGGPEAVHRFHCALARSRLPDHFDAGIDASRREANFRDFEWSSTTIARKDQLLGILPLRPRATLRE